MKGFAVLFIILASLPGGYAVGPQENDPPPAFEPAPRGMETLDILPEGSSVNYEISLPEEEWRRRLDPVSYLVLREQATERPYANEYYDNKKKGIYYSKATGEPLFHSEDKFESGTGWPCFTNPITPEAVLFFMDSSHFMQRVEVVDSASGSHLGHVFNDGPGPEGLRYCINSASLIFIPEGDPPPVLGPDEHFIPATQ